MGERDLGQESLAKYDPNRLPNGQFASGHKIRQGTSNEVSARFHELKALWYSAVTVEDMAAVRDELVKLCLSAKNEDVKLKAIVYFVDRMLGRVPDRVEVDVGVERKQLPELSAEEVVVLQRVVERTGLAS